MKQALTLAMVVAAGVCLARGQLNNDARLLETGTSAQSPKDARAAKDISIVTYNIRWRAGDELKQISDWLIKKDPSLIALQEVDRSKQRTNRTNNARALAQQLGMNYAWA